MVIEKTDSSWINFRHLYAFWMVARESSFTRASERMRVSQSSVSAHVAGLEEYLDEELLVRTNRSVELAPAGIQLLSFAHKIFEQSRAINTLFRDKARLSPSPALRVGVVGGASRNFVFRLVERCLQQTPTVKLSVSTGSYEELYDLLKKFQLDSIICLELPKKKDLREVSYEKLATSQMCVVATPELFGRMNRKDVSDPIDVFKFSHPFEADVLGKYVEPLVAAPLKLRLVSDDIPLLRFLANSGQGVAILPRVGVLEDLESGSVKVMNLKRCPEITIYGISMINAGSTVEPLPLWGMAAADE